MKNAEFQKRCKMLAALGAEYSLLDEWRGKPGEGRKSYPINVFSSVKLPLKPKEWLALCMNEGSAYVGGCCGTMGHLQDRLNHIFRQGSGWVDIRELEEIAEIRFSHDDEDGQGKLFKKLPRKLESEVRATAKTMKNLKRGHIMDPWHVMAVVWHITKDFYSPKAPSSFGEHIPEKERAISILRDSFTRLDLERLFESMDENSSVKHPPEVEVQRKAGRAILLAKMLPALKTLNDRIHELDLGNIEGFALVREAGSDDVMHNGYGYCIYETSEGVDKMLKLWQQQADEYQGEDSHEKERLLQDVGKISVRKVRVSTEKGLEFLS